MTFVKQNTVITVAYRAIPPLMRGMTVSGNPYNKKRTLPRECGNVRNICQVIFLRISQTLPMMRRPSSAESLRGSENSRKYTLSGVPSLTTA